MVIISKMVFCVRHHVQHFTYSILVHPYTTLMLFMALLNVVNAIIYPHFRVKATEPW